MAITRPGCEVESSLEQAAEKTVAAISSAAIEVDPVRLSAPRSAGEQGLQRAEVEMADQRSATNVEPPQFHPIIAIDLRTPA